MSLTNNTTGVYWNNGTAMAEIGTYYCGSHNCCCHNANEIGGCTLTACNQHNNISYEKVDNFDEVAQLKMRKELERAIGQEKEKKVIEYTSRWKDFQFRSPTYLGDSHVDEHVFDLVKWKDDACWSVGKLIWDPKEESFDFESVGMRYLEYYVEGLNEWVLAFAKMKEVELRSEDD